MDEIPIIKKDYIDKQPLISSKVSWHSIPYEQLEIRLSTDFQNGLSQKRVADLQKRYGMNLIGRGESFTLLKGVIKQFKSPLVFILLAAGILTLFLGDTLDATVIFLAICINVSVGVIQEERSFKAFRKLQSSEESFTPVIRDGKKRLIRTEEVVIGDIVIIESGMHIPADIRILEATDLSVNEAPLTGEWVAVPKQGGTIDENKPIFERYNMLWAGTLVVAGFGRGIVVETGKNTQIGEIAESLSARDTVKTPIQINIHKIAVFLTYVIIGAIFVIFGLGILRGEPVIEMVLVAVAVAVSAIPEGLPAVVTVVLAIGMEKILKERGLVRNILTAETLGSTTVIITDKTGTLTEAKMSLGGIVSLNSLRGECAIDDTSNCNGDILRMGVLASDAFIEERSGEEDFVVHGRPIEKAIVVAGLERGISELVLSLKYPRLDFLVFSSENRFAVSLNKDVRQNRLYFSGSPEHLLEMSTRVWHQGKIEDLNDETRMRFIKAQEEQSREGKRVTAIAFLNTKKDKIERDKNGSISKEESTKLVFAGLLAFGDPLRADVPDAIREAQSAGARVIMATGDNPETARSIAYQAGIIKNQSARAITGTELEGMSDEILLKALREHSVFARVLPSQKLRMVNILRNNGEIVAMTGDGINDAPALKSSDIGIVVGSGTDVAKEASDLVLLDNSFAIIVGAIKEGRRIIDNLKRIIAHLLSTSFSVVILIIGSLLFGGPLPILPAQILWNNIIGESILNFSFAFEPAEVGVMKRRPSMNSAYNILSGNIKKLIFTISAVTGVMILTLFGILLKIGVPIDEIRTMLFVALSLDSALFLFALKSFDRPIWHINIFSNKVLFVSVIVSLSAFALSIIITPIRNMLQLTTLSFYEILVLVGVAVFNLIAIETVKYFIFWKNRINDTITQ